jgi:hypothetical protein
MLENLIRERVHFTRVAHTGFHHCVCEVCHDHTDRGGFKFDGGEVGYNCFNCGAAGKYTENSGELSKKFRKILNSFSIANDDLDKLLGKAFFDKAKSDSDKITLADITTKKEKKNYLITPEVELPKGCLQLGATDKGLEVQEHIANYLLNRKIDITAHPFFFSLDPKKINYVIIPFYRNGKIIYWQGRNYSNGASKKDRYDNCTEPKENIIFNIDELFRRGDAPLFVTEGVFDALPLNGVALLGSKINEAKLEILKKSKRDLIFVIDKDKNGRFVAEKALENGWKITFAPQFTEDVNKSIITYGKCWTIFELFKQIPNEVFEAKMLIELYCSK